MAWLLPILTTWWAVSVQETSIELDTRPYLTLVLKTPHRASGPEDKSVSFWSPVIVFKNTGKTPAANIQTIYYLTTDGDKFENRTSCFDGIGAVTFVPTTSSQEESQEEKWRPKPNLPNLSGMATQYYFEALAEYEGIGKKIWFIPIRPKRYWVKIQSLYDVNKDSDYLLLKKPLVGSWDQNEGSAAPPISKQEAVKKFFATR